MKQDAQVLPQDLGGPAAVADVGGELHLRFSRKKSGIAPGRAARGIPKSRGDIRLVAFITEPERMRKILTHLGELTGLDFQGRPHQRERDLPFGVLFMPIENPPLPAMSKAKALASRMDQETGIRSVLEAKAAETRQTSAGASIAARPWMPRARPPAANPAGRRPGA